MEGLFERQFQQQSVDHLPCSRFVDPEFAALPGVFGHRLAILAGHGDPQRLPAPPGGSRLDMTMAAGGAARTFFRVPAAATAAASFVMLISRA